MHFFRVAHSAKEKILWYNKYNQSIQYEKILLVYILIVDYDFRLSYFIRTVVMYSKQKIFLLSKNTCFYSLRTIIKEASATLRTSKQENKEWYIIFCAYLKKKETYPPFSENVLLLSPSDRCVGTISPSR